MKYGLQQAIEEKGMYALNFSNIAQKKKKKH